MPNRIQLALDAVGGDHAPLEIVKGAAEFIQATPDDDSAVLLVGDQQQVRAALAATSLEESDRLKVVHASQTIAMDEHPMEAVRRKPDSSIALCAKLVKSGEAHATVSAGNTGACMVAALLILERFPGISRPPIASLIPTESGQHCLLVDAGSNIDCQPSHLSDFALLGSLYAETVLGIPQPRVALLSNGEEDSKGSELVKKARPLLQALPIHYTGNIEGNHVFEGEADVVVCDGFEGNILLKTAEGMGKLALTVLEREAQHAHTTEELSALRTAHERLVRQVDYAEYGGAPLLGVQGLSLIAHGRSNARAIRSALRVAAQAARSGYIAAVKTALEGMQA